MAYIHNQTHHKRARKARASKKIAIFAVVLLMLSIFGVLIDLLLIERNSQDTVVSETNLTSVQAANINIFQSPYFSFQADDSWSEVTDDRNINSTPEGSQQYLYRSTRAGYVENELWVTVNLPGTYKTPRHIIPTHVYPVRVESDGQLTMINGVSDHCIETLEDKTQNLQPHILEQDGVEYLCHPNDENGYNVIAGIPGGTSTLEMPHGDGEKSEITITYRSISQAKQIGIFEDILSTFQSR